MLAHLGHRDTLYVPEHEHDSRLRLWVHAACSWTGGKPKKGVGRGKPFEGPY
jgi:hypothetical protein